MSFSKAGELWAELVNNRGFEAETSINGTSNIYPWIIIGENQPSIIISMESSSCFEPNKIVLHMDVFCHKKFCPRGGVVSFVGYDNGIKLASIKIRSSRVNVTKWSKMKTILEAKSTNHNSNLQITTTKTGVLWLDQISAMPLDTYKGHVIQDLGAYPIWVFNNGISHHDEIYTSAISPFVQEALDGIEFAIGSVESKWGSLRASMGHPKPFDLRYVGIGNEDCGKYNY
ncbi:unnamed protein product [Vicia faba]|uniref:Alpha-L-arabinofuranosidase 1 catalytic domain-containing protein n=1 Tax=Vicia faba TaxID=3906 RepID=A0AAV1AI35_VICFA|nr:unnamed protein product [Vicia faba]